MSTEGSSLSPKERAYRRAQREARARYAAQHLECCRDATSVVDWRRFRRHHPRDWHQMLRDCFRGEPTPDTCLEEYLRMGAGGLLLAKSRSDTTAPRKRKAARHVAEVLGHLLLAELDEEGLEQARRDYVEALGGKRAHALITHDLRILRQAAERGRKALGLPSVAHAWPYARPRGRKKKRACRLAPSPQEVWRLLAELGPVLRVAVVLMVGLGLRLEEVRALRVGHLDIIMWQLRVPGNESKGPVLRAVPVWCQQLIWDALPQLAVMPPGQLPFESPVKSGTPRTDIGKKIRAAAIEAGLIGSQDEPGRFSPRGLRRLFQAVARANFLPSALVRGSLGRGQGDEQLTQRCLPADRDLARRWVELLRTPGVGQDERPYVPVKAPKGVGPMEPEIKPTRERWKPPWSPPPGCLELSPGERT